MLHRAVAVMTIDGLAVLPLWYLVFRPYLRADISLSIGDMPPFIWVPTVLFVPAVVLGWIGLRSG